MAYELCEDCGKKFECGPNAYLCPECRKKRLRQYAIQRGLNKIGNDAYSKQQAEKNVTLGKEAVNKRPIPH